MLRVCLAVVALVAVGCGVDPPATSPTPLPAHGTPSKIELSATAGVAEHGGTATVTARVLDAYSLLLPDVSVAFSANTGTFSAATVATNAGGLATTTLTADPGTVKVTAAAGSASAPELPVSIQPVNVFTPPPPGPVPPPPLPDPKPQPPAPSYGVTLTATPSSVVTGAPVTLTATVTPNFGAPPVTSWSWDCDTSTSTSDATTANTATCTYATAGTFTAAVVVSGGGARGFGNTSVTVTAPVPPPVPPTPVVAVHCAQAVTTPPTLTVNCNVSATLDGVVVPSASIVAANWDFGDAFATTSTTNAATHLYGAANTYTVLVTNVSVPGTTAKGTGSTTADVK